MRKNCSIRFCVPRILRKKESNQYLDNICVMMMSFMLTALKQKQTDATLEKRVSLLNDLNSCDQRPFIRVYSTEFSPTEPLGLVYISIYRVRHR